MEAAAAEEGRTGPRHPHSHDEERPAARAETGGLASTDTLKVHQFDTSGFPTTTDAVERIA
jgi:hypothetical protein